MPNKSIIMVVDDQPDFVEGVKLILEIEGYEVWTASNGQQALERLQNLVQQPGLKDTTKKLPQLILADIMMPVMDGYTLYNHTQNNESLRTIPFIFLTAKTGPADLQQGKELGVEDYLTKPCVPDVLLASVRGQLKDNKFNKVELTSQPVLSQTPVLTEKVASKRSNLSNALYVLLAIVILVTILLLAVDATTF
jgi:CheY-like chemotaxis protein